MSSQMYKKSLKIP